MALRDGSTLHWLLTDHLGGTAVTATGTVATGELRYHPFSQTRDTSGTTPTSQRYTGQREDGTGLVYMNARYYDPAIGQFISPDTIVPDPGKVFAYNRYMYVNGNPLRYTDPTGHYSDDALMTHFGCDDWACVEGQFGEGGQHAGRWGWLATLMAAEDGDSVTAWSVTESLYQEIQGTFRTVNGMILVDPNRLFMSSPGWDMPVHLTELAGAFSELDFASRGVGISGMYASSRGPTTHYNQKYIDCSHHADDCMERGLNIVSTGVAVVGAGCAIATAGACAAVAGTVGIGLNAVDVLRTGVHAAKGDVLRGDVAISLSSAAVDFVIPQQVGPALSGFQWYMDEKDRIR